MLIYCSSEGGRLSRPSRHCSKCAAHVQSWVLHNFREKHRNCLQCRFNPGTSHATGKHATTKMLRLYEIKSRASNINWNSTYTVHTECEWSKHVHTAEFYIQ